ncbi:aspartate aminotransferase family protein [Bacillus alkalicellulosilyticus]|uniref:aspartate aminotransferase family protein n=1 Tax=Alkalihalobacterium alkalicellulosilyticum TaxID=1912214 RepID=UPI000996DDC7|nr:acetylornithine transaminase [Bacillus alkalicellulosilyticus]
MSNWQELDQKYMMNTYNRLPIAIERGVGNYLYDTNEKGYLDLFTGLAVNILGHSHPIIVQALKEQGEKFLHISNVFLNKPAIQLAESLISHSLPNGKVFFSNSGAEATEAAIKLIHKWTKNVGTTKQGVVVLKNSFHGRTLGALKLTRQAGVYQDFPVTSMPIHEVEPHNLDQLERVLRTEQPAAVIMEPVLGSGGILPLEESYLQEVSRLCKEHKVLCCMDEIQTGIGRTGKFFAYQYANIQPDLILFAKGVGGGLPLGGIIVSEPLTDLFKPGDHGTTFAPAPLSAALGNAVLEVLFTQGQLEKGKQAADYLWNELLNLKDTYSSSISEIRGKGMMLGIVMKLSSESVKQLQRNLLEQGFLVDVTQQTIVRLLPPLTLEKQETDEFLEALEMNLKKFEKEHV